MERALVTGGSGFIGSHLVQALAARGIALRILDVRAPARSTDSTATSGDIEYIKGDIRDAAACRQACRDVDAVFHMAALVSVPESIANPALADAINTGGTLNMLLAARDCGVRRFVFSSSCAVYGDTQVIPTDESVLPCPTSPYGVQKLAGEHYARSFHGLYGLETVVLRYFNVYGPRQNPNSDYAAVIPKFITRLLAGQAPTVYGDGEQTRDFCSVQDVVAANLLAAGTTNSEAIGNMINIATGTPVSLNALLTLLRELTGRNIPALYEAARAGDIRHSGADITRARAVLGFTPNVSLAEGLKETLDFFRTQPGNLPK